MDKNSSDYTMKIGVSTLHPLHHFDIVQNIKAFFFNVIAFFKNVLVFIQKLINYFKKFINLKK